MAWTLHGWKMGFLGHMNCSCPGISCGTKGYLPPQNIAFCSVTWEALPPLPGCTDHQQELQTIPEPCTKNPDRPHLQFSLGEESRSRRRSCWVS